MGRKKSAKLAGIQYAGIAGVSVDCKDAVMRLLQYGDQVSRVCIVSASNIHCLLLSVGIAGDLIAIKSGFSSGYGGEGPRTFSCVLQLLYAHGAEIEEREVSDDFIRRLDDSALTVDDINFIESDPPLRPSRWPDYIYEEDFEAARTGGPLWQRFPPVVPFAIIDPRIADLAKTFWENPDGKLLSGYRRLEEIIRKRTKLKEHGHKLFSQAFLGSPPRLTWSKIDIGEQTGRAKLFIGAYMAYRNPRAHNESKGHKTDQLSEFLLLNELYRLEQNAKEVRSRTRNSDS